MTKLIFRYSDVYDDTLTRLSMAKAASKLSQGDSFAYAKRYQTYWDQYNDSFFAYFREFDLILPSFWLSYFITPQKGIYPFSDPLTIPMDEDFEEVTASLVHELGHVFLTLRDNHEVYEKLHSSLSSQYKDEAWITQVHLMVIVIAVYGLRHIYGQEKTNHLLEKEKHYWGMERAWEILDTRNEVFEMDSPIEAILSL